MIKYKTSVSCILFITVLFFEGFADLRSTAQNRLSPPSAAQPYLKCSEIKNDQIADFASDNNQTILIEKNGDVRLIDGPDNLQNWSIQFGSKQETIPYFYRSKILFLSYTNKNESINQPANIRQINPLTGVTDWITPLDISGQISLIRTKDTEKITLLSNKLNIRRIDSKTGKILLSIDLKGELEKYASGNGSLHIITTEDKLFEINIEDGSTLSEIELKSKDISAISSVANSLFVGDLKGILYKLSDNSKTKTKLLRTGGEISFIESLGNDLMVISNDNFLYYYSTDNEKTLWKKRLSGRVILKPVIHRDLIFITTPVEPVIYVFDRTDGTLINQIDFGKNYIIKKIEVSENSVDILTTTGLLKFGVGCRK